MSGEREYSITLKFPTYDSLINHLAEYGELLVQKRAPQWLPQTAILTETVEPTPAPFKKENDGRGKHTAQYHELAREMKANQPELSYRECYKFVSKKEPSPAA